ncbi:MAG TPA: PEP-CTERM sorting domain-containing protein [Terriglobales bacterium]|nr:PEP-CTERM sorting domain-containing protein [Terriglobales bacterium]
MTNYESSPVKSSVRFSLVVVSFFVVTVATTSKAGNIPSYPIVGELTITDTIPVGISIGPGAFVFETLPNQYGADILDLSGGALGPDTLGRDINLTNGVSQIPANATISSAHLTIVPNYYPYQFVASPDEQTVVSASTGQPCSPPECLPTIASFVGTEYVSWDLLGCLAVSGGGSFDVPVAGGCGAILKNDLLSCCLILSEENALTTPTVTILDQGFNSITADSVFIAPSIYDATITLDVKYYIPEPSSLLLLSTGIGALLFVRRKTVFGARDFLP